MPDRVIDAAYGGTFDVFARGHPQLALATELRERLVEGDSDQEAVDFIVSRYGEFVLLRPDAEGANLVLWLAPPLMAALGLGIGWATIRRRKRAPDEALSAEEEARLEEILKS